LPIWKFSGGGGAPPPNETGDGTVEIDGFSVTATEHANGPTCAGTVAIDGFTSTATASHNNPCTGSVEIDHFVLFAKTINIGIGSVEIDSFAIDGHLVSETNASIEIDFSVEGGTGATGSIDVELVPEGGTGATGWAEVDVDAGFIPFGETGHTGSVTIDAEVTGTNVIGFRNGLVEIDAVIASVATPNTETPPRGNASITLPDATITGVTGFRGSISIGGNDDFDCTATVLVATTCAGAVRLNRDTSPTITGKTGIQGKIEVLLEDVTVTGTGKSTVVAAGVVAAGEFTLSATSHDTIAIAGTVELGGPGLVIAGKLGSNAEVETLHHHRPIVSDVSATEYVVDGNTVLKHSR
jgi:hypothetical protein